MKFYQAWTAKGNDGIEFPANVPGTVQSDYAVFCNWDDLQYSDQVAFLGYGRGSRKHQQAWTNS